MIILLKDTRNIIFISNSKGSIKIGAKFVTIRKDKISQESVYYCLCFHIYCNKFNAKSYYDSRGRKEVVICKNRKCSVALDGNLNVYLSSYSTNL